jgi:predicted dehydrogenase
MKKKIRIAIIGAGMYACTTHMPAFRRFKEVEVVAVCRKDKGRLRQFRKLFKIPRGYTDYREMLDTEKLDGVLVSSPHSFHYEHARAALERAIPVLIEKPMTIKISDAREIVRLSEKKGIPVVVGYNRHFWANFCYAKKMIEENEIGDVQYVSARWVANIEWALARTDPPGYFRSKAFHKEGDAPNFRGDPKLAGGGMFIDGGSNMADAILWTTELRPERIASDMENRGFATDCDTALSAVMSNGALLSCAILGASKTFKGHELYIYGTKGTIFIDDYTVIYQLNGQKEVQVVDLPGDSSPTANFVHVLQGRDRPHCTAKDGLRTAIFVDAAYRAAKSKQIVSIQNWV